MLRDSVRGLFLGDRGDSAPEYAILLGFVVLAVGGGAVWLGGYCEHSLSSLFAEGTASPPPASPPPTNASGNANSLPSAGTRINVKTELENRFGATSWGAFISGAAMIGLVSHLLARRRVRKGQQLESRESSDSPDISQRFSSKRQDLLRLLAHDPAPLFKNALAVRHLMTTDLITVGPGETRTRIEDLMREKQVRHLLVCSPGGQLLGIVSDRDLDAKHGKTAGELMCKQPKIVSPDTLISPATTQLLHAGVSSLPVVEDGRPCGVITRTDLLIAFQCVLQLWLHAASMLQSEEWEKELLRQIESQLDAPDGETCRGVKGVFEAMMIDYASGSPDLAESPGAAPLDAISS